MKYNMKTWIRAMNGCHYKKPMPLLSFPSIRILGCTVKDIVTDSKLQAKGMKAIADRTDAAASVSFMDLSVEAECFGATVAFSENEIPSIKGRLIHNIQDATVLEIPSVGSGRTQIYIDAVHMAKDMIVDRPILAGIIGPFSLAARLLDVSEIMMDCYDEPDMVHLVLEKVTCFLIEYAKAYRKSGAHGIVMAEPVSGLLSPTLEAEFSSPYVKKIVDAVQDDDFIVIYHNCGGNVPKMLRSILSTGASAYHFGNAVDMQTDILSQVPENVVVMGNIDPAEVLELGTRCSVRKATFSLLEKCANYPNFVPSSGCDIPPMTPLENIDEFFAASRDFYGK